MQTASSGDTHLISRSKPLPSAACLPACYSLLFNPQSSFAKASEDKSEIRNWLCPVPRRRRAFGIRHLAFGIGCASTRSLALAARKGPFAVQSEMHPLARARGSEIAFALFPIPCSLFPVFPVPCFSAVLLEL